MKTKLAIHKAADRQPARYPARGSVLVMVVVLLVLLALIGTAFIATARTDRISAQQNVANTQIDLLVEGMANKAIAAVIGDLWDQTGGLQRYRRAVEPTTFENWDSPLEGPDASRGDPWLAARIPEGTSGSVFWRAITGALSDDGKFTDPRNGHAYQARRLIRPTVVNFAGKTWPAIEADGAVRLAGDADGDGIADSGLILLARMGPVTYYGCARIIDCNSAVNASTAWSTNRLEIESLGLGYSGYFLTHVGLREMLLNPAEITNLNGQYRFGPYRAGLTRTASLDPRADDKTVRTDFRFVNEHDAMHHQLARRLDRPGWNTADARYQALSLSDSAALAYRFCLINPDVPDYDASAVETLLSRSLYQSAANYAAKKKSYPLDGSAMGANTIARWFAENFDYGAGLMPLRPLIVARNPVSNQIPLLSTSAGSIAPPPHPLMKRWEPVPRRASLNTAQFPELFRAFWCVMRDEQHADRAPFPLENNEANPSRMFRNSIRPRAASAEAYRFSPFQQLLLRSALAAANVIDFRDPDNDITAQTLNLRARRGSGDEEVDVRVTVYGLERQPFITEVYVNTDTTVQPAFLETEPNPNAGKQNKNGYIAVELHNPYNTPIALRDDNYRFYRLERDGAGGASMGLTPMAEFPDNLTIPAGGYIVLDNYQPGNERAAQFIPRSAGNVANRYYLAGLHEVIAGGDPPRAHARELVLVRLRGTDAEPVPIDQFDFSGHALTDLPRIYRYVRPNDAAAGKAWQFVHSGWKSSAGAYRYPGEWKQWDPNPPASQQEPTLDKEPRLGSPDTDSSIAPLFTIQLNNTDFGGPRKWQSGGSGNRFPFGYFARLGDLLQVPFIGSYTVRETGSSDPNRVIEINSVTHDAAFADDEDPGNDNGFEQLGRFCPIVRAGQPPGASQDDFDRRSEYWRYRWAFDLFDYFTVIAPHDDYLPNIDPTNTPTPAKVITGDTASQDQYQDDGVDGLININTAHWKVLAALPMHPVASVNQRLAMAIARYRDEDDGTGQPHGPFTSFFELMHVPGFEGASAGVPSNPPKDDGDISPLIGDDQVAGDFEQRFLILNRISNLITLRSDMYTCYIQVQGWRDGEAGGPPELVAQRRLAFFIDRSMITAGNRLPRITVIPND